MGGSVAQVGCEFHDAQKIFSCSGLEDFEGVPEQYDQTQDWILAGKRGIFA
jgi:hypothetical protein